MQELPSWREILSKIITNPSERERIAREVGVRSITLTRWITGESTPRTQNVRQLLHALPKQHREQLLPSLEEELYDLSDSVLDAAPSEISYKFIMEVHDARTTIPDTLRFWTISRLVLQQALRQLDPERVGMAITLVRCMAPHKDGMIYSLRETMGLGTPPWTDDLEQQAFFLGAESLAGYVVATCRPEAVQDLAQGKSFLLAYQTEHEVSATAHPIMFAGRIAGCLLLSSTQPNYFLAQPRTALIHGFTNLITLAFEPEEFYKPELIKLRMMPSSEVQQTYFASFHERVLKLMRQSAGTKEPLTSIHAEQLVWQQLEELLLHLPV